MSGGVPSGPGSHAPHEAACASSPPVSIPDAELQELRLRSSFYGDVCFAARDAAKHAFGGNCTFVDDDITMLCHFACWALDQGYRADISDTHTLRNIAQAIEARRAETGTGSVHESAVGTADASQSPPETPHA